MAKKSYKQTKKVDQSSGVRVDNNSQHGCKQADVVQSMEKRTKKKVNATQTNCIDAVTEELAIAYGWWESRKKTAKKNDNFTIQNVQRTHKQTHT